MNPQISDKIEKLKSLNKSEKNTYQEAEEVMKSILTDLLTNNGYTITHNKSHDSIPLDFLVEGNNATIGIEHKHVPSKGHSIGLNEIYRTIGVAYANDIKRVAIISNVGFSNSAIEFSKYKCPTNLELIGIDSLIEWGERLINRQEPFSGTIAKIIKDLSAKLALEIAKNPKALDDIEWRDLERIIAEIFSGLGFDAELTPSSKDGGKDVIVTSKIEGTTKSYIIEIKHWRSNQKVGTDYIREFINVVMREKRESGLFLATYGFAGNAIESLSEIERRRVKCGEKNKIHVLCQHYSKASSGLWSQSTSLPDLLFDGTE